MPNVSHADPHDPVGAFVPGATIHIEPSGSGGLDGLSAAVKDVFDIAGTTTGFGNPTWARTHPPAKAHAFAVKCILDAGATIVGKTITDELAFSMSGVNHHYGAPINSAAPERLTGGSSSGSAAAVAAGLSDFALGTDTGGSVRAPASFCGLFGFRPTHDAISTEGVCPLARSFDVVGWFARDAKTFASVGDTLLPPDQQSSAFETLHWDQEAWSILEGLDARRIHGWLENSLQPSTRLKDRTVSADGLGAWFDTFRKLQFAEVWQQHRAWLRNARPELGGGIKERLEVASQLTDACLTQANAHRDIIRLQVDEAFRHADAIVVPTVPGPAPMRDASLQTLEDYRRHAMRLLCISGLSGCPQVTMPVLRSERAPLGLSLIGPRGSDRQLLAFAAALSARLLDPSIANAYH